MFENPIAPRERKSCKDFKGPTKGEATTGRYMCAGTEYGVGFRTPVGTEKGKSIEEGPIPLKNKFANPNDILAP